MSKKSNRGKPYFYANGQRDRIKLAGSVTADLAIRYRGMKTLPKWARFAYINGFNGT